MSRWQAQSIRQQSRRTSAWPRWLALVLFLLALVLLARVVVLHHLHKKQAAAPVSSTPAAESVQPPPPQQVQFDFYTVLPKMAVSTPTPPPADSPSIPKAKPAIAAEGASLPAHLNPPVAPAAKPLPATAAAGMFVLQIAAVRQQADAERMRDQMHSAGYPAFIQPYQADQILWYRVMVGPFASQDLAERTQVQLKSRGANSLILKMQPHSG